MYRIHPADEAAQHELVTRTGTRGPRACDAIVAMADEVDRELSSRRVVEAHGVRAQDRPLLTRKLRVVVDWTVSLFFRRDIVELSMLGHPHKLGE